MKVKIRTIKVGECCRERSEIKVMNDYSIVVLNVKIINFFVTILTGYKYNLMIFMQFISEQ